MIIIFAPFPAEEQVEGSLTGALLNARIDLIPHWPFVRVDCFAPARDLYG
jgi:hypothetical protein